MRRSGLPLLVLVAACAGGSETREPDGTDTEGDELGSSEITNDTIDPTAFTTTMTTSTSATADTSGGTASSSDASESGSESGSDTTSTADGPTVVDVAPADGSEGIEPDATFTVTFSAAMDPTTVVGDDGSCSGAVQLSRDDFASCVALAADAIASEGDTVFELVPADVLDSAARYRVRVTTDAAAADSTPLAAEYESEGFRVRYFHTIAIDGMDDWNGDESFATSTNGHTAYTAWDDDYVYLAMRSPDVAAGNGQVWVVIYFGGAAGTSEGALYNTQQPALPFDAQWHLRWRADNVYTDAREWDGASWDTPAWAIGGGDVYQSGELLELRVARSDIGDPDTLELHMGILRETDLDEASWAAHPQGSYVDGYDPMYTEYWAFDLLGSATPAEHVSSP
ncbi:MAG TPA: Ig-like domain-containing protein [Nannocystaceae bacterium]|nr:Ig-like domain-containing protein [Nannocystaceae bacterium]